MEVFQMLRETSLARELALDQIRQCFFDLIEKREAYGGFVAMSNQPELEVDEQREASRQRIAELHAQLASRQFDGIVQHVAKPYLMATGHSGYSPAKHVILEGVARAMIEDQQLLIVRLSDGLAPFVPADSFFREGGGSVKSISPISVEPISEAKGPTVGETVRLYLEWGQKQWVAKTHNARIWQLGYLQACLGEQSALAGVNPL